MERTEHERRARIGDRPVDDTLAAQRRERRRDHGDTEPGRDESEQRQLAVRLRHDRSRHAAAHELGEARLCPPRLRRVAQPDLRLVADIREPNAGPGG
jgi:hypothetical protein